MVKGSDALADALLEESMSASGARQDSPADSGGDRSATEADDASDNTRAESVSAVTGGQKPKSRRKKALETMSNMVTHLKSFVEASLIIKTYVLIVLTHDD